MASAHTNADSVPETRRLTAPEIFQAVMDNARGELRRSVRKLAFSGVAGGITMGLTGIGVASLRALLGSGPWAAVVSYMAYPIGFIAVIIGRSQLFTENTLYPVILVLDERRHVARTLRLWGVVFGANVFGACMFALLAVKSGALRADILSELVHLGADAAVGEPAHLFWSGVIGGWMIALVAWTVTASHWTIGQLAIIYLLTFVVGAGRFAHCIASSCEILSAVMGGAVSAGGYLHWLIPATLGNICGGVFIVSLLNYAQVRRSDSRGAASRFIRRLAINGMAARRIQVWPQCMTSDADSVAVAILSGTPVPGGHILALGGWSYEFCQHVARNAIDVADDARHSCCLRGVDGNSRRNFSGAA